MTTLRGGPGGASRSGLGLPENRKGLGAKRAWVRVGSWLLVGLRPAAPAVPGAPEGPKERGAAPAKGEGQQQGGAAAGNIQDTGQKYAPKAKSWCCIAHGVWGVERRVRRPGVETTAPSRLKLKPAPAPSRLGSTGG
jgi:hypothetical protein